jgi:hypothetical protein
METKLEEKDEVTNYIFFNSTHDINLKKITNVNEKNIYQIFIDGCVKYITTEPDTVYIGIMYNDNTLHIFNMIDDELFPNYFKSHFKDISEIMIHSLSINLPYRSEYAANRRKILKMLEDIPNFVFIRQEPCFSFKNLDAAKEIIRRLNIELDGPCPDFKISIDYVLNLKDPSFVSIYEDEFNPYSLLLCLFNGNNCVSSLILHFNNTKLIIDSKTHENYEGRKFNKLLRAVIIIIGKSLEATNIHSDAINPTSVFLMLNSFNAISSMCKIGYKSCDSDKMITLDKTTKYSDIKDMYDSDPNNFLISLNVELTPENMRNAKTVFDKTITEINCRPISDVKVLSEAINVSESNADVGVGKRKRKHKKQKTKKHKKQKTRKHKKQKTRNKKT